MHQQLCLVSTQTCFNSGCSYISFSSLRLCLFITAVFAAASTSLPSGINTVSFTLTSPEPRRIISNLTHLSVETSPSSISRPSSQPLLKQTDSFKESQSLVRQEEMKSELWMRVSKGEVVEPRCGLSLLPFVSSDFPSLDSEDSVRCFRLMSLRENFHFHMSS